MAFVSFNMGYSLLLYVLVATSRNILKQNSQCVKSQIGIFRRNILTLKETILQMFVLTLMEFSRIAIAHYAVKNQERGGSALRTTIYIVNIILNLLVNDILIGVLIPCKAFYNMVTEISDESNIIYPIILCEINRTHSEARC